MYNYIARKKSVLSIAALLIAISLLVINIYGLVFTKPVQLTVSVTREVLYDTNSYAICMHLTDSYVYVMEPSLYQSSTHSLSTEFFAKGDYEEIHNVDGYISKTSNATFLNIIMRFSLPDNWTRLIIYREEGFSTTEDRDVSGLYAGNVNVTISYIYQLYNSTNGNLFIDSKDVYMWVVSEASLFITSDIHQFAFTKENATTFGLPTTNNTLLFLNFYIYNIISNPLNPTYNFSAWLKFGLGYKIYKNTTLVTQYSQYPNTMNFLITNLLIATLLICLTVFEVVLIIKEKRVVIQQEN